MTRNSQLLAVLVATAIAGSAYSAVSPEEAKSLGGSTLTLWGAEKAGNKDGTIPAYTGEGIKAPANVDAKNPRFRPDPFANEKPLFTITAKNAAQYADKLDGMMALFKRYPDFRMDIYPSHRGVTYPKWVLDNTVKNATSCKGVNNEMKLEGCYGGYAFPIPKSGTQVMWNHLTYFEANAWEGSITSSIINPNGTITQVGGSDVWQQSWYYDPARTTPATPNTVYWALRIDDTSPSRRVGGKLILIDALDTIGIGRRAYQYIPGQRRVKLAPDLAYDTPSPNSGGVATMDDAKGFLGALDRYDWKLIGKKEKYIMYNNFKLGDKTCPDKMLLTKSFANPDCVRWELHRVWVVDAKLKPGFRHIYPHRLFYWDEDGFSGGMAENYDAAGNLYRIITNGTQPYWAGEGGGQTGGLSFNYDLQTGNWSIQGSIAEPGTGYSVIKPKNALFFSPEALAGEGVR